MKGPTANLGELSLDYNWGPRAPRGSLAHRQQSRSAAEQPCDRNEPWQRNLREKWKGKPNVLEASFQ